ncbi:hypothetical protein MBLNU459_g3278t1 [Dothideomycetes sp. NU459]
MAEEGGQTSIAARIAALKLDQVGRQHTGPPPPYQAVAGAPVLPGKRPELSARQQSTNVPPLHNRPTATMNVIGNQPDDSAYGVVTNTSYSYGSDSPLEPGFPAPPARKNAPSLPPRRPSAQPPQLPPRRPSDAPSESPGYGTNRRLSTASTSSALSTKTSVSVASTKTSASSRTDSSGKLYTIKAPAFDPSTLPPLPPKREKSTTDVRVPLKSSSSTPDVNSGVTKSSISPQPQLPARPPLPGRNEPPPAHVPKAIPGPPRRSALEMGFGNKSSEVPSLPAGRPGSTLASQGVPPPIPTSSRPDLSQLMASKPKLNGTSTRQAASTQASNPVEAFCLKCRDFSAVDAHAARFPRQSLPSHDLGWLSHQLTSPFATATDKARAIFTWLHHNVAYDTVAFFSNNVQRSTPASTLRSGLAVCEGYAALFTALAIQCGLESIVVVGHGKGGTYKQLTPGAPLPPYDPTGHAWSAVKLDDGEWKLIDACWGAGNVNNSTQTYTKAFKPDHFTRDNNDFGTRHFPSNPAQFYRTDGRASISWEEYLLGNNNGDPGPQMFSNYTSEEGIAVESFQPFVRRLRVNDPATPSIRFQFNKVCQHWDNERHGKGKHYAYSLFVGGVDGRKDRRIPFETNGYFWWVDVSPKELGAPGGHVSINAVTSWDGKDGRGLSAREIREKDGRVAAAWGGVARWDLI